MNKITLRLATDNDAELIWKMQEQAFAHLLEKYQDFNTNPGNETLEKIKKKITSDNSFFYLILNENTPIGAIRIKVIGDEKRISPLFILPEYTNKGFAQQTILLVEEIYGNSCWALETIKEESRNCHLYEKMGYIFTGKSEKINNKMTLILYYKP